MGRGGGGGEDRMVVEWDPFDFVFGGGGPARLRFSFLQVEVEPHSRTVALFLYSLEL